MPFRNLGNLVHPTFACLSEVTLKAGGPSYLVSMSGEGKDPTQCVACSEVDSHILVGLKRPAKDPVQYLREIKSGYFHLPGQTLGGGRKV